MLFDGSTNEEKTGKIRAHLLLEHNIGFCKIFEKIEKGLMFELQLETSNEKQKFIYTTLAGNDVNVTINSLYSCVPSLVPSLE